MVGVWAVVDTLASLGEQDEEYNKIAEIVNADIIRKSIN
jgi:hypothetical protein